MESAIQTAVGILLFVVAALVVIVLVRTGYERNGGLYAGSRAKRAASYEETKGKRKRFGGSGLTFNSRAAKRQEASEGPADPRSRYLILGGVIGAVLGTLLVKLWSMQVISSKTYTKLAEANARTTYTVQAPRGRILDRNGNVLVDNRSSVTVMANPDVSGDRTVMRRLSVVLGIPYAAVRQRVSSTTGGAQADRVVASDAPKRAVAFISEHPQAFPGIHIESRTERSYPYGTLAAHVLGYTGTISEEELAAASTSDSGSSIGYESGDIVGKAGAEYRYESVLQGIKGERTVEVDASGNVVSQIESIEPQMGNDVRLTLDIKVQQRAEESLQAAMEQARKNGDVGDAGAVVCMDVKDGGIIAMTSYPTYDPSVFIGGVSNDVWDSLSGDDSGYPLTNRAIAGQYPAASTFKAFTGLAGLEYNYTSPYTTVDCTGTWTGFGKDWPQKCWYEAGHGPMNFIDGIVESCDVVFYEIARQFYRDRDTVGEDALQDFIKQWGFGSKTGIDLPGEAAGRVPTPEWKLSFNRDTPENGQWMPGDYSNLIIGQGDLLVTPLQVAQGYMCIAGNGSSPVPHVFYDVLSHDGQSLIQYQGRSTLHPSFKQSNMDILHEALTDQVTRGHVIALFDELGIATAGKTGTGEVAGKGDCAWYVGYGPVDDPKYVCSCVVEQGGAGGEIAAPVVRNVLAAALGVDKEFSTDTVSDSAR